MKIKFNINKEEFEQQIKIFLKRYVVLYPIIIICFLVFMLIICIINDAFNFPVVTSCVVITAFLGLFLFFQLKRLKKANMKAFDNIANNGIIEYQLDIDKDICITNLTNTNSFNLAFLDIKYVKIKNDLLLLYTKKQLFQPISLKDLESEDKAEFIKLLEMNGIKTK